MGAFIAVDGAMASLTGAPIDVLEETLTVLSPNRFFSQAWKQGRWDGKIRLYRGNRFPAGHVERVVAAFAQRGEEVLVREVGSSRKIEPSAVQSKCVEGFTLWDHQLAAVRAMVNAPRGYVESPTASGKTLVIAVVAKLFWEKYQWKTLVMVPRKDLLRQHYDFFRKCYGDSIHVGMLGDSYREPGVVTVATGQTLRFFQGTRSLRRGKMVFHPADPIVKGVLNDSQVLILDETHRASSTTWLDVAMNTNASRRYGLSGTPLKHDEVADLQMMGATGPRLCTVSSDDLIGMGLSAKPKIAMVMSPNASGPELEPEVEAEYANAYFSAYVENAHHNTAVIRAVEWMVHHKRQTLVLCKKKAHYVELCERLTERGIQHVAVWGDTPTEERNRAKKAFAAGRVPVLVATTILDEGVDLPKINAIVLAEGGKSWVNSLQRIGRGMRGKDGDNDVWIVDFVPTCSAMLSRHAIARSSAYDSRNYESVLVTRWPAMQSDNASNDLLPFEKWAEARTLQLADAEAAEVNHKG